MRGYPRYNFDAFDRAAERLRSEGYEVVSPADHDRDIGFNPDAGHDVDVHPEGFDLRDAIMWDLEQVSRCDVIYMLNGWYSSRGANLEHDLAEFLGKEILYEPYLENL
jgi:hypothetical protein